MKSPVAKPRHVALTSAVLAILAGQANALGLSTYVGSIYQVGASPTVKLGHTVLASTNYNRLNAGGTYTASCIDPTVGTVSGSRGLSTENIVGGLQLQVTIPAQQPAYVNMPGYYSLPRGSYVTCMYFWTSQATEGGYSVGAGGISFQTGNGTRYEGGTAVFSMTVPGNTDPNENSSCIP